MSNSPTELDYDLIKERKAAKEEYHAINWWKKLDENRLMKKMFRKAYGRNFDKVDL